MRRGAGYAAISIAVLVTAGAGWWASQTPNYLPADTSTFAAGFWPPPSQDSAQVRAELDELLSIQAARTPALRAAARADRKKDVRQFYGALGIDVANAGSLTALNSFLERVEDDVSLYVRAVKQRFSRPRPYVVERRLEPCIGAVADDQAYPSGHSAFGYTMALVLSDMVPERRDRLLARAKEFARQRMICGVHYASDIAAGRRAAEWLVPEFEKVDAYRAGKSAAAAQLRAALGLPPAPPR